MLRIWLPAAVSVLALAGCRSEYTAENQRVLAEQYYGGDVAAAAKYASAISEDERGETSHHALLWHLEAGNANLDAGNYAESMRCLDRAEKLLYLFDGGSPRFHRPGLAEYRGFRSDRLLLHLLKGFNYLAEGKLEDFLVEIRRLRAEQFRYVLQEADPELRSYEESRFGKRGVPPLALSRIFSDSDKNAIYRSADLSDSYLEYSRRRRPRLPLFYNPLGFYLSSLGYTFDREYEEATIDLRYLLMLDPENRLYREDFASLLRILGDRLPDELAGVRERPAADDQVVCFIVGRGRPDGWNDRALTYRLPGKVPTEWVFSYPAYRAANDPGFSVRSADGAVTESSRLADLSEIMNEEFWQWMFPGMVDRAYAATVAMTVAHTAAKASLAAAMAMKNSELKPIAVATASAAVAATSRAFVNEREWRRWITIPRSYSVAHVRLPGSGTDRKMTLLVNSSDGKTTEFALDFAPETNRAVVYLRELDNGKFVLKNWESRE